MAFKLDENSPVFTSMASCAFTVAGSTFLAFSTEMVHFTETPAVDVSALRRPVPSVAFTSEIMYSLDGFAGSKRDVCIVDLNALIFAGLLLNLAAVVSATINIDASILKESSAGMGAMVGDGVIFAVTTKQADLSRAPVFELLPVSHFVQAGVEMPDKIATTP